MTREGLNATVHALADAPGRRIGFVLTAGRTSGPIVARALPGLLPTAGALLADSGYCDGESHRFE
jgi:hypothetical protein